MDDFDLGELVMREQEKAFEIARMQGEEFGKEEQKKRSYDEGYKMGVQLGNEFEYYTTIVDLYFEFYPEYTKSR